MTPEGEGPHPWALDLEKFALHRGSLLGGVNQPGERNQKDFDSLLWDALRVPRGDYLVLEGESVRIGKVHLPAAVVEAIRRGVPLLVRSPLEERAARIIREYSPETWSGVDIESFRRGLGAIAGRVSRNTVVSLETAFDDGRFTDVVKGLLVEYYDPLYQKSCVDGRDFALEFETGPDPVQDARRFGRSAALLMRERNSACCA
jgi:tRNA 2-selenouridine synthase